MDVVLVRWPAEATWRGQLAVNTAPRLLLVEPGQDPPEPADCMEDWIRVPASEADVRARIAALARRASNHTVEVLADGHALDGPGAVEPALDAHGILRVGPAWVPLPPVEARLTEILLSKINAVVSRDALARAGWPDGAPGRNALDVHVLRLRRRLATVGLAIRTVRSRGYLLELAPVSSHLPA